MKNYKRNLCSGAGCILVSIAVLITSLSMRAEYFRHLTLGDGLSQTSVLSIMQDKLGRMWFGTKEGVNIYDGTGFKVFKGQIADGDHGKLWIGNKVNSIQEDSLGNIYLHIDNDIVKYEIKTCSLSKISENGKVKTLAGHKGEILYITGDSIMSLGSQSSKPRLLRRIHDKLSGVQLSFDNGNFYLSTKNGLYINNRKSGKSIHLLPDRFVYSTYVSRDGSIWIATSDSGLYRYRIGDREPESVSMPVSMNGVVNGREIRYIVEDQDGKIWYGTFSGLYRYDPNTNTTSRIEIPQNIGGLSHSSVYGLYCDRKGNIWVGTFYGGINYFSPRHDKFVNFNYTGSLPEGLSRSLIKEIVADKEGNIWFATDGAGVGCLDINWNLKDNISSLTPGRALRQNNVRALSFDKTHNRLFIGTHRGGLSIYDIDKRSIRNLIDENIEEKPGDIIHNLKIKDDNLYITSNTGLYYLNLASGKLRKIPTTVRPRVIDVDSSGNIYFSSLTGKGLYKIYNPTSSQPVTKQLVPENEEINTTSLCVVGRGVLRSTLGHGLIYYADDMSEGEYINTDNSRLPDDYCYAIAKGIGENVYIASGENIVQLNLNNRVMRSIPFSGIFSESHIVEGSALSALPNGDILVGSTNGISLLSASDFEGGVKNKWAPKIYFSRLIMQNKDVYPDNENKILTTALPYADKITLPAHNNDFSIIIGLNDYVATTGMSAIEYKMDGIDDEWLIASGNEIRYRNLPSGKYTLRARQPGGEEISMTVIVETPWYATWWAWVIYIVVILGITCFIIYKTLTATRLKLLLRKEMNEKELIKRVNQEKLVFFTDVSHEFQTPLTLINSHIDNLQVRYQRNPRLLEGLSRIRSHSSYLSHLVTQLLEFRKIQQNKYQLHIGNHNASETLRVAAIPFKEHAENREMEYIIDTETESVEELKGVYDPGLINKVLVNIISNAFKYTQDGGRIYCTVKLRDEKELIFEVKDNGRGISKSNLPYIFDRFFSGNIQDALCQDSGIHTTGIGLAFAKTIVDRHHGKIEVESEEGHGSIFRVILPTGADAYEHDDNVIFGNYDVAVDTAALPEVIADDKDTISFDNKPADVPLVLIVEDNKELRENLLEFFADYYRVDFAIDGEDGLTKARSLSPDIIISDVLMPKMKGTEMCSVIKSDRDLCHIPVILLTALHSTESKLEGLNTHADDYVTKPFDSKLLLARVDNLLRLRRMLKKQFEQQPIEEVDMSNINPLDRDLIRRTTEIIDRNIGNLNFDIPTLCKEVGMSRSLFFNKFKSLMGMTPNAYIQSCRLKYAAKLLKTEQHLTIAEIADKCGFETPVYFSRCFKKQFGVPPLQYRKEDDI